MSNLITLLAVPLFAVAPSGHTPRNDAAADSARMTLVVVQNEQPTPVTVYADEASGEYRLGVVPAFSTETLRIPDPLVIDQASIDFVVAPKGSFDQDTGYLEVRRSEHIGVIVPPR